MPKSLYRSSMISMIRKLRSMRGTPAGRLLAAKPAYYKLVKSHLKNNPVDFDGFSLFLNPEDTIITEGLVNGDYETLELDLVKKLVPENCVMLDLGANVGLYTVLCGKLAGASGRIFSFEPDPLNFSLLQKNIQLNGLANVTAVNKAVYSEEGEKTFYLSSDNKGDHRFYPDGSHDSSITVSMVTVDGYLKDFDREIDLIKIDVQGAEIDSFLGMKRVLSENKNLCIMIEYWPYALGLAGHDPKILLDILNENGFSFFMINDARRKLDETDIPAILDYVCYKTGGPFPPEKSANLYCFKNRSMVPDSF